METSLISVITPSFNSERFIKETIQSVKSQTYSNWEMIIVDDASTDKTREIIDEESKSEKRIKVLYLEKNSGPAVCRNKAIDMACGDYFAFLDSDDIWHPKKLETQVKFMEREELAFSFTSYVIVNEDGSYTGKSVKVPRTITYNKLLKNTIIGCLTVMLDVRKIGKLHMPNIRAGQDTAYWLKILKKGYTAYGLNEQLSTYRKVNNSVSSNKLKALRRTWVIYRRVEQLSFLKATWCFGNYLINAAKKR
ncbi:glycosyltransferase family 2 protein [Bacillus sp. FJAT-44742]|uniref:glycosyltransferase family 2 protein n=1 Tax=Bacillus sp. FJAT-44742 TaxID=2014005 RepID=UPI000C231ECF|nr:glycosyltransferase family 2 protein [Bacillus sp. FJAT-44742]